MGRNNRKRLPTQFYAITYAKVGVFGIDKTNLKLYKKINDAQKQLDILTTKDKKHCGKYCYLTHTIDEGYFLPQNIDELEITIGCNIF